MDKISRHQIGLKASMRGSDFFFDSVQLLYYKCHKINVRRGGSYVDSPDWKKKEIINSRKEDDTCFQYAVTIALNYGEINLKFNVPNEIPVVFHNGSNYDYHFIVKELAN